jgi:hypothetical protein
MRKPDGVVGDVKLKLLLFEGDDNDYVIEIRGVATPGQKSGASSELTNKPVLECRSSARLWRQYAQRQKPPMTM